MIEGAVTSSRSCSEDISNYSKREKYNENKRTNADLQQTKELFRNEVKLNNEIERSQKSRDLQSNSFELKSQISIASQSRTSHLVNTLSCLGIEVSERKTRVRRSQSNQVRSMESHVRRPKRVESEKSQRKHSDESKMTPLSYHGNRSKKSDLMEDSLHNVETNNLKIARSISGPCESVKTPETIPHITQPSRMINNTSENEIIRNLTSKNRKLKRSKHSSRKEKSMSCADLISSKNNSKHTEKGKRCQKQQQQQPFQNLKAVSTEPHKACEILDYTNYISAMLEDTTKINKNGLHLLQNTNLNGKNKIFENSHESADKHKTKSVQKLKRSSSVPSTYIYSDKYKCLTNKNSDIPNQTNLNISLHHDVAISNKDDLPLNEDSKVQRKRKHFTGKNTNLKRTSQTNLINEGNETMLPVTNICPNKEQCESYEEVDDTGCADTIHELSGIKSNPCHSTEKTAGGGEVAKHNLQCNANACVPSKMNICVNDKEEMLHKENITILNKIDLQGEKVQQLSNPENIEIQANTEPMTNEDGASDINISQVETENNSVHGQLLDYPATDHEENCFEDDSKLSSDMVNMENVTRPLVHVKQGNDLDNKLLRSQSLSIDDRKLQIKVRRQKTVVFPYDSSSKRILASKQSNVFPQKLLSKHHNKSTSHISTLDSNSLISSLEIPLYGSDSAEHHGIPHRSQTPNPTKQNFDSVGQMSDKSLVPSENVSQAMSKSGPHPDKWTQLQFQNLENPDISDHKARMLLFSREMNTDNTDASSYTIIESSSEVDEQSIENNSAVAAVSESILPTKSVDLTRRSSFLIQTTMDNHRQVRRSKSERQTGRTQTLSKA